LRNGNFRPCTAIERARFQPIAAFLSKEEGHIAYNTRMKRTIYESVTNWEVSEPVAER
jgi:hypothetical protein